MARGALSENECQNLNDEEAKSVPEAPGECRAGGLRVRFLDEEGRTQRTLSTDELDCAVSRVKKIHFLKNRSSSETSVLLRGASVSKRRERRHSDAMNNNSLRENLNGRLAASEEEVDRADTRDLTVQSYKKNCNVYSVNQARTLTPERGKAAPLSMPRFFNPRAVAKPCGKSALPAEVCLADAVSGMELTARALGRLSRGLGRLLRRSNSVRISDPDPVYKVAYLGNVLTGWARGETCVEKPLATLWKNYQQSTKPDVVMKLSVTNSGLKGFTKEHGLTEYWSHRITYCASPPRYPKLFCWVYRHEGKKLKHELRCHAVLCTKESVSKKITEELQVKLKQALNEFKKDRISKQNARLSLANSVYDNPTMPRRKILLSVGSTNYRPPLERSKSAPKLGAIEELCSEEDEEEAAMNAPQDTCSSWQHEITETLCASYMLDRRRQDKSPRKLSCPEGVLDRNQSSSESHSELADQMIELLVAESNKHRLEIDSKTSQSGIEKPESRLQAIAEAVELNENGSDSARRVAQSNYLVTDSDDGSVSSGCETASTVTSSDAEPSSLPSHFPPEEIIKHIDREGISDCGVYSLGCDGYTGTLEGDCSGPAHDEVNHVPIGEKNAFRRRSTYPPLRADSEILSGLDGKFESLIENLIDGDSLTSSTETEVYKMHGDNDSACSDESGYSELLDNGKDSIIGNTIMV